MYYDSPAFDINGNLVTVSLLGGDYSNLPAGYYTTPGQAAVARGEPPTPSGDPISAQQVAEIYADPSPDNQDNIQQIFDEPPPPVAYVAPTPPVAQGWVAPAVTPPPTPAQIIAQIYVDQGYTPPPAPVIAQIISGAITAPITEPLTPAQATDPDLPAHAITPASTTTATPAPQNNVATNPATAQTAGQSPSTMPQVFDDTAAFVAGQDSSGQPVMQLVDANGNLVQWVLNPAGGYFVAPFYVTTPPAINEKRLVGADVDGNPVFQLIDQAHNLLQWTENHGQTGYIVNPFYVSSGATTTPATSNPPPSSQSNGQVVPNNPGTTQSLSRPTKQVGVTLQGAPVMQLVDEAGVTKQWIQDGNTISDLRNAPTYGVLLHTAATDQSAPVVNTGGGQQSGGGNPPASNGGGQAAPQLASQARPQIQVGTTSAGWPIYQIGDDAYPASANKQKQWIINPGPPSAIVDIVDAPTYGVLLHDSVTDAAVADHGGGVVTPTVPTKSNSTGLVIAVVAAALLFAALN